MRLEHSTKKQLSFPSNEIPSIATRPTAHSFDQFELTFPIFAVENQTICVVIAHLTADCLTHHLVLDMRFEAQEELDKCVTPCTKILAAYTVSYLSSMKR